jgi:hypothetical protein
MAHLVDAERSKVLLVAASSFFVWGAAGCGPHRPAISLPSEVTLYVAVSDQVARTDTGNVAAMVDALEADLREAGHTVSIVAARDDERAPIPRVEVQVRTSDPADKETMAGASLTSLALTPVAGVVALGTSGSIQVDAFVVSRAEAKPQYLGRIEASSFGGATLGQDETSLAGDRAGHRIAKRLLR